MLGHYSVHSLHKSRRHEQECAEKAAWCGRVSQEPDTGGQVASSGLSSVSGMTTCPLVTNLYFVSIKGKNDHWDCNSLYLVILRASLLYQLKKKAVNQELNIYCIPFSKCSHVSNQKQLCCFIIKQDYVNTNYLAQPQIIHQDPALLQLTGMMLMQKQAR